MQRHGLESQVSDTLHCESVPIKGDAELRALQKRSEEEPRGPLGSARGGGLTAGIRGLDSAEQVNGGTPAQRKRKRTLYSKWQQVELESVFAVVPYPDISTREHLAKIIRLPESKVQVWFQNRRARKNKSGKLDKSLYKRGSSTRTPYLHLTTQAHSQICNSREPLISMQFPSNQPLVYGSYCQQEAGVQQVPCQQVIEASPPHYHQQYFGDDTLQYNHGQQGLQWECYPPNKQSPHYGYNSVPAQMMELEHYMTSQLSYLGVFPQGMDQNGSQTSLGSISDLIYNSAIITNAGES
ncbi:homeobox protein SEBOX [Spea bombifrons]|uniref:homeobox protein SEBOX n=1 Tax=Spea bombifrons TaxID=233779 RepID=UPI00234A2FCD|nr:homeobox protein SEBOX [Spea bombifrons]